MKILLKSFAFFLLNIVLTGCFYFTDSLNQMNRALESGKCKKAHLIFLNSIQNSRSTKWHQKLVEKAGSMCFKKDPRVAIDFYQYLTKKPSSIKKQMLFHQKLAFLFSKTGSYQKAATSYQFLIYYHKNKKDFYRTLFLLAKLYFNFQKWEKSLGVIKKAVQSLEKNLKSIKTKNNNHLVYLNFLFLKARVLLLKKDFKSSQTLFLKVKKKDLQYFNQHNGRLYLAFLYEKRRAYDQAIFILNNQPSSDFLNQEIQRLKNRKQHQPGGPL